MSLVKGDPGKGRQRNSPKIPNPNNTTQLVKRKNASGEPASGYRERKAYGEISATSDCSLCPKEGFTGVEGVAFLRGSLGVGWGYQLNLQKAINDSFTDFTQGWALTGSRAWGLASFSVEGGVSVSSKLVAYLDERAL